MNFYEELQEEAYRDGINVCDYSFSSERIKGLYCDGTIAIRQDMTTAEKSCVLAEELGYHRMTIGNILNQNDVSNWKQELLARFWAYNKRIGLSGIIQGCRSRHELADCLDVSEEFLAEALECYLEKYGLYVEVDEYVIQFDPVLAVYEKI